MSNKEKNYKSNKELEIGKHNESKAKSMKEICIKKNKLKNTRLH